MIEEHFRADCSNQKRVDSGGYNQQFQVAVPLLANSGAPKVCIFIHLSPLVAG